MSQSILGADEAPYVVPDAIEPIRAWRAYRMNEAGNLESLVHLGEILPGEAAHAVCGARGRYAPPYDHEAPAEHCTCGIYAARDLPTLDRMGYTAAGHRKVIAEVSLWGRIVPAEMGYRAQFCYPHRIYCEDAALRDELAMRYGVECLPLGEEIIEARWISHLLQVTENLRKMRAANERAAKMQAAIDAYREGRSGRVPHPAHYSEARGNYGALLAWIRQGRRGDERPYRNNTTLEIRADGRIDMRLHATVVASWDGGQGIDSVVFDTGGWDTMTTRERMNDACSLFGIGGSVGSDAHYMPRIRHTYTDYNGRTRSYTEGTGCLRWWPAGYWNMMPKREHDGRTREGKAEIAAIRDWIRANCPEI